MNRATVKIAARTLLGPKAKLSGGTYRAPNGSYLRVGKKPGWIHRKDGQVIFDFEFSKRDRRTGEIRAKHQKKYPHPIKEKTWKHPYGFESQKRKERKTYEEILKKLR